MSQRLEQWFFGKEYWLVTGENLDDFCGDPEWLQKQLAQIFDTDADSTPKE